MGNLARTCLKNKNVLGYNSVVKCLPSLCLVQFPSHKSVMLYAAEMILKLKTRTQKTGGGDPSLQQGEGSKKRERKERRERMIQKERGKEGREERKEEGNCVF
uniref:Uncharacterized protein n=1 Tax=Spermophilus dauricus TaxID=99837 RepID=A0A8C9QHU1_SPEDA